MYEDRHRNRRVASIMNNFVPSLVALLSLAAGNSAQQFGSCDYVEQLVPGRQYYVFNNGYPQPYRPGSNCRWIATSDRPIKITCDTFELPASPNCVQDAVTIVDGPSSSGRRYCGNGRLNFVSQSNRLTIAFTSSPMSRGGKFLCTLETVPRNDPTTRCRCGWKNPSRIVGGEETGVNEYPMMAGLVDVPGISVFCGGTIVNPKQVLTAAHCVIGRNISTIRILVGDHDLVQEFDTNATRLFFVDSIRIHPNYNRNSQDNDMALVDVHGTIAFNQLVGPACLPFQHAGDTFAGNNVVVLGWGSLTFGGGTTNRLQKARLTVIPNVICRLTYRDLTVRQLCTYARGKDSCQLDSGGPVLWQNPSTQRIVGVGVISSGNGCASGSPSTNSRVTAFMNWIVANRPTGFEYCRVE